MSETPINSRFHTNPVITDPHRVSPVIVGSEQAFGATIRPVKYRYVLADVRTGRVISTLPMTAVNYGIAIYSGTEMSGSIYLPDMHLDQMAHTPLNDFERWRHPDRGLPLASLFEVGNRALYVMRNSDVVWGGILWGRSYSSGNKTMEITALSWEGYIYYRALRQSVLFPKTTDKYTIWRALLAQVLMFDPDRPIDPATGYPVVPAATNNYQSDFGWNGENGKGKNAGRAADVGTTTWTGKSRNGQSNQPLTQYLEYWPYNSPPIELPPAGLQFKDPETQSSPAFNTTSERWHGFDMGMVGEQLQTWADANTLVTKGGFEYRVLCWWDELNRRFRQRYTFGEMEYDNGSPTATVGGIPTAILNPLLGRPHGQAGDTVLDFPGHISDWSLTEGMEEVATRVIVTGNTGDDANSKIAEYRSHVDLLRPGDVGDGSNGWLLYDRVIDYDSSSPGDLGSRAEVMLSKMRPPLAATIDDMGEVNSSTQRTSQRGTDLSVTLYQDPTTTFPEWNLGDWVTFAISDPFYGGTMYLQRRIIGYSVQVIPDMESDYSHEQISLELTDETKIAESAS